MPAETPMEMAARLEAERRARNNQPPRTVSRALIEAKRPGMLPYLQGEKPLAHACSNPPDGMTTRECLISHYGPAYSSGLLRASGVSYDQQRALTHPPATDEQQASSDDFLQRMLKENVAIADKRGIAHNSHKLGSRSAAQPVPESKTKNDLVPPEEWTCG